MKAVLSRVNSASVSVHGETISSIHNGVLALIGVHRNDTDDDATLMARKIAQLRILDGEVNIETSGAPVLVVSQFTLQGRTEKGRRPSWVDAAPGEQARVHFDEVAEKLRSRGIEVYTGRFGADMVVDSANAGPFTVLVDTHHP